MNFTLVDWSSEKLPPAMPHFSEQSGTLGTAEKMYSIASDVVQYNKLLEGFLDCKRFKPLLKAGNVGDGSFLLKMDIEPLPALTTLVTEQKWPKLMESLLVDVWR